MNNKLKVIATVLALSMITLTKSDQVFAAEEIDPSIIGIGIDEQDNENNIIPRYVVACSDSSNGKHYMYPKGTGAAYDVNNNNKLKFKGQAGQCKYCKLVLITEYNPFLPSTPYWGQYVLWNPGYEVETGGVMYTNEFGESYNKSDYICTGFYIR